MKFIRYAHRRIEHTGEGVLGFVTNHSYLNNPTFRGMRKSLLDTFDEIYLLDLHGNSKKKERTPNGGKDENVFDIQQGVAIGLFVKRAGDVDGPARVFHADLWGERPRSCVSCGPMGRTAGRAARRRRESQRCCPCFRHPGPRTEPEGVKDGPPGGGQEITQNGKGLGTRIGPDSPRLRPSARQMFSVHAIDNS